jgi:hypothetical protein
LNNLLRWRGFFGLKAQLGRHNRKIDNQNKNSGKKEFGNDIFLRRIKRSGFHQRGNCAASFAALITPG